MSKIWSKIKNFCITNSQRERETSDNREVLPLPSREMTISPNQKTTSVKEMVFVASTGASTELVNSASIISDVKSLSRPDRNSFRAVEVGGIEPPRLELTSSASRPATPTANSSYQKNSVLSPSCPYCSSENFVKRGLRQKKTGKTQLYICKSCNRTFTPAWTKNRQHSWSTMLEAMSYYNLGFSLAQTCEILKQKFGRPVAEVAANCSKSQTGQDATSDETKLNGGQYRDWDVQPSTIAAWMEENKELCSYHRMRSFAVKHFSPYEVVETCTLAHRQLYRFRYHRAKTKYIMEDDFKHYKFYPLKEFLDNVTAETPHQYFQRPAADVASALSARDQILRASEAPLKFSKTEMIVRAKENYATKLTELVFQGVSENKARHEALQRFLIANDSVTVATEVPVYIKREDLAHMMTQLGFQLFKKVESRKSEILNSKSETKSKSKIQKNETQTHPHRFSPSQNGRGRAEGEGDNNTLRIMEIDEIPKLITGHIDFLQIRNGSVHILDYKSNAAKERPIEQLTLYALALSRLTGLRLFYFKCAWFDEKDYFEFFPLHVVYKPGRGRKKIYTKEGVYDMNERADRMESLRPIYQKRKTVIGKPNF